MVYLGQMVRMQWRHLRFVNSNLIYGAVVLLLIGLMYVLQQGSVKASSLIDWTADGNPVINSNYHEDVGGYLVNQPDCSYQKIATRSKYAGIIGTSQLNGCVVQGKYLQLAHTSDGVYVSFGSDSYFYKFHTDNTGILPYDIVLVPNTDRIGLIISTLGRKNARIYDNLSSRLSLDASTLTYRMTNWSDELFSTGDGTSTGGVTINLSNNGRYAVYQDKEDYPGTKPGIVRVDLETGERKQFGIMWYGNYASGTPGPHYAISNDGNTVVGGGINWLSAWSLSEGCVKEPYNTDNRSVNDCPTRTFKSTDYGEVEDPQSRSRTYGLELSDDASELSFVYQSPDGNSFKRISISPAGYIPQMPQLDYLALGDSYSSGEGDIDRKFDGSTYYLEGTDVAGDYENDTPQEKCHISSRSYPFILQQSGASGGEKVKSIACSGAKRVDVQGWNESMLPIDEGGYGGYLGQSTVWDNEEFPRLARIDRTKMVTLQSSAIFDYVPGRVQQAEFIELYRPRVATLTIGGNDLGFGKVLRACISKVALYGTCDYATEKGRKEAGSLIKNFRMQLVDVYEAIQEASPRTKLFVLGYPQFISSTQNFCGANSTLSLSEREFITESVVYLNQVVKSAAHQAGAYYIDIEDALGENILCTVVPDKYVNGLTAILQDRSEPFHPNRKGHAAIASHIKAGLRGQTLKDFNECADNEIIICPGYGSSQSPDIPEYLNPPSIEDRIVRTADIVRDAGNNIVTSLNKGAEYVVRLNPFLAQPTTMFSISLHSEPFNLGDFAVAADGSLSANITVPSNVPAGYHTLYAVGKTYSGEAIMIRQIIQVRSGNPDDIDENGLSDSHQPCGPFMVASGTDTDLDGIDDACDPYINEKPELYRWRLGHVGRTYNGNPEDEGRIYIERNIWASSRTGIAGDYDADGDGWAIVGVSHEDQVDGVSTGVIDDTIDFEVLGDGSQNNPYFPVIYVRPGGRQCKAYRPTDLSRVLIDESRTISIAEISNEKCPQELPDNSPQEPDINNPPKNEKLLDWLHDSLQELRTRLRSFIRVVINQLHVLLRPLR